MIRFIDLKGQMYFSKQYKTDPCFAFYDTIVDRFMNFCDSEIWDTWEEFQEAYRQTSPCGLKGIERYKRLIPNDYFNGVNDDGI